MKRIVSHLLLAAFSLNLAAASLSRYTSSRIFWDARSPVTIFSGGGYARLIELQDGRLLACSESGGIKISFSSDKGATWTTPKLIAPNTNNTPNCVPDLVQLSDGTILVGYNPRPSKPYTEDRRFGIRLRRSTNNGRTWSDEIFVYDADYTFENGCWEPSFLELPGGELQLYFADESPYTNSGEQQISMCRSFDGGLTWTQPQCISFRSGYRDGMPVPVLLGDKRNIVVAIEDNGWSGVGDFLPTTVRTALSNNWKNNTFVSGSSSQRNRSINYDYCPMAKGGAPYLRVLPNGETVLSHQSTYGDGDNMKMYVYVGDKQAKDFKAMSRPFYQGTKGCWWNSLAVIDTGIVVAVGGMDGRVVMVKGYPMQRFAAPYGTPKIDGRFSPADTYFTANARQVPMGNETGTFSYTDFAYDSDNLYVTCLVYRPNARSEEPFPDGINFYIESKASISNVPRTTAYRFSIKPDGTLSVGKGNGKSFVGTTMEAARIACVASTNNYRIELAIPWGSIGLDSAPIGRSISVNLEVLSGDGTTQLVEQIPDTSPTKPATWVLLNLMEPDPTGIGRIPAPFQTESFSTSSASAEQAFFDLQGRRIPSPSASSFRSSFSDRIFIHRRPDGSARKVLLKN